MFKFLSKLFCKHSWVERECPICERRRITRRAYNKKNSVLLNEKKKARRLRNVENYRTTDRAYYLKNKERIRAYQIKYQRASREYQQNYREQIKI